MNVLVLTDLFPSRAKPLSGRFYAELLVRLPPCGVQATVVSPRSGMAEARGGRGLRFLMDPKVDRHYRWKGLEVFRPRYFLFLGRRHLGVNARSFCSSSAPVCQTLHRIRGFDLVVGYGMAASAHAAQYMAKALGLRSVCWAMGSDINTVRTFSRENERLLRHNIRYSDLILTESDALRRAILAIAPEAKHVCTYYKGIDLTGLKMLPDRSEVRQQLGLAGDAIYMISAGQLRKSKGSEEFYEAFRRLARPHPALRAIWIGDGPEAEPLQVRARSDGLGERFSVTSYVPHATVLEYMAASDLFAFASHAEGLPNVVMEAMGAGLPCVVTDVGGVREVIAEGLTGWLVPPRDVNRFTGALDKVLGDPAEAQEVALRGRALILKYFDVGKNVPVAANILRQAATMGPPQARVPACAGIEPGVLPLAAAGLAPAGSSQTQSRRWTVEE